MRTLGKEPEVLNAANHIVQYFRSRFTQEDIKEEKEINKLSSEKSVLKSVKREVK